MDSDVPSLGEFAPTSDRMPALLQRFQADRGSLERLFSAPYSARRRERLADFFATWNEALNALPFAELTLADQVDAILFRRYLDAETRLLYREAERFAEMEPLLPFATELIALEDARRRLEDAEPSEVAETLDRQLARLRTERESLEAALKVTDETATLPKPTVAFRAAETLERIRTSLQNWFGFHSGYDPLFTWWVDEPWNALETALTDYTEFLRKKVAGAENPDTIIGDPIGRDALIDELERSLLPYTPEELIAVGEREREWCLNEFRRAASELGLGDDWKAALEKVKGMHVPPGQQPALIRELAREAEEYVTENDLLTVPPLARETWRMEMMTPERQRVNPFFLGGEAIIVSFPTNTMEHGRKKMSMRGNNRYFARATVQHELIPGHRMQSFFLERYRPYRRLFSTPFWTEGWTLHWEMFLWDRGFPRTPEERIGMLFWRLHRCCRIVFSLKFHLGEMTAAECVDFLVDECGHERDNAEAEVRRSFGGAYPALYQAAYLLGGLQVRALHRELTTSGAMTDRQFHDAFLRENYMPIAVLRALLSDHPLTLDFPNDWRFATEE
jgi:hypothetical protein